MARTRLAVIGVGHLGKEHARILADHPEVELVGVADPRAAQADAVAQRCRTEPFADYRLLLGRVDAAVVAVPTCLHHAVACDFLRQGVPLLVEKPLAPTLAEADELLRLSRRHGAFLQVGHIERFNPAFEKLQRLPLRPKFIQGQRLAPFSGRSLDIGVVLDLMIHDIDMLLALVPAPVRDVQALGARVVSGHEDMAHARLTFANGCVAQLSASRVHPSAERRMDLWGVEGYASADFQRKRLSMAQPSERMHTWQSGGKPAGGELFQCAEFDCAAAGPDQLTRELNEFVASVRTGAPVRVPGEHAREALAVASQVLGAIHRHAWEGEVAGPTGASHLPVPQGRLFAADARQAAA